MVLRKNSMRKRILNQYRFEEDYVVGICSDGSEFFVNFNDYERIKEYTWRFQCNSVYTNLSRGNPISLQRFLLGVVGDKRVLFNNKNPKDCRRNNLYNGNTFVLKNCYYDVTCYGGKNFMIDINDYDKVKKYTWHVDKGGYVITKTNGRTIKLHRYLLDLLADKQWEVDHINRNKLDNRRKNLRLSDRSGNCINKIFPNNTSGTTGVYWNKSADKWCVQISKNNKRYYLGSYDNYDDACKVRRNAELKYHKEFSPNN